MTSWASRTQARAHWADAVNLTDARVDQLLAAATRDVRFYAPATMWRVVTPVTTTAASATVTGPAASFTVADVDLTVTAPQVATDTTVAAYVSDTTLTLSVAATGSSAAAALLLLPVSFVLATIYQAREIYSASIRDGDLIGSGDLGIRARPLTAAVKQLIRPATRTPVVG